MDRKKLVNQSIDYIMQHLDETLSLNTVAAHFFISKYHFSRIFKEETGESVYVFIKRCKIDQSAIDMKLNPARAITDIGLDYGYSSSNYSSVFRTRHAASPAMYQFLDEYKAFFNEKTILVEQFFNDPAITSPPQCICDICMTVEQDCDLSNVMWIGGGQWIVYHFDGKIKDIFETLQGIFSVWLPQSGYKMTQKYGLNI